MIKVSSILKKLLIAFIAAMLLIIGSLLVITKMIDDQGIKNIIVDRVHQLTGQELKVLGKVETYMFPTPHVMINRVRLGDLFSAESIDIQLSPALLYTGAVELRGLTLNKPVLHLEKREDGTTTWDFGKDAHQQANDGSTNIYLRYVIVNDGKLEIVDGASFKELIINSVNMYMSMDGMEGGASSDGNFSIEKIVYGFKVDTESFADLVTDNKKAAKTQIMLSQDNSLLKLEGVGNINGSFSGKLDFKTDTLQHWQTLAESLSKGTLVSYPADEKTKFSASLSADATLNKTLFSLKNAKAEAGKSKGDIELEIKPQQNDYSVDLAMNWDVLDVNDLGYLINYLSKSNKKEEPTPEELNETEPEAGNQIFVPDSGAAKLEDFEVIEGLPANLDAYIDLKAKKVLHRTESFDNLSATAQMVDGEIILSQALAELPGKSQAVGFGILKKGYQGLTFEGSLEMSGASLKDALVPVFPGSKIPQKGLGAFKLKSNIYVSSSEIRFSEADLIFDRSRIAGALIAYLDKDRPLIDSALRLYSIDFDALLGSIGWEFIPDVSKVSTDEFSDEARVTINADWLRNIPFDFTTKVEIEYFKLLDKIGKKASVQMQLGENLLRISSFKGDWDNIDVIAKGDLANDALAPVTNITAKLNKLVLSDYVTLPMDFGSISPDESLKKRKALFEKTIALPHLMLINGTFDFLIDELSYKDQIIPGVIIKGKLEDGALTFERVRGKLWGGILDSSLTIVGGSVPALASSFTMTTVDVAKLLAMFTPIDNITGKVSLNGSMSVTGINVQSMLESATGTMSVAGRDITVGQFDLPGIIKAVATVRTVADIVNVARLALPGGRTDFYAVDGALIMKEGIAEIPGMVARTQLSDGSIKGKLNFFDEALDLLVNFKLISIAEKDLPTLGMKITGPIRDPQIILDTKSLETYVAKKTADKILQRAPELTPKVQP